MEKISSKEIRGVIVKSQWPKDSPAVAGEIADGTKNLSLSPDGSVVTYDTIGKSFKAVLKEGSNPALFVHEPDTCMAINWVFTTRISWLPPEAMGIECPENNLYGNNFLCVAFGNTAWCPPKRTSPFFVKMNERITMQGYLPGHDPMTTPLSMDQAIERFSVKRDAYAQPFHGPKTGKIQKETDSFLSSTRLMDNFRSLSSTISTSPRGKAFSHLISPKVT